MAITAPPPTKIIGLLAACINLTASATASSVMVSPILEIIDGTSLVYSVFAAVTSFVMSTRTGPGRPDCAILNALLTVAASLSISFTMKLCFVIGIVTPAISTS